MIIDLAFEMKITGYKLDIEASLCKSEYCKKINMLHYLQSSYTVVGARFLDEKAHD